MIPSQIHKPLHSTQICNGKNKFKKIACFKLHLNRTNFSNLLFSTLSHLLIKQSHSHKNIWSYIKRIEYHVD